MLNIWWNGQIDPTSISIGPTIDLLIVAVIGGISYLEGAWLGAFVFVVANNYMRDLPLVEPDRHRPRHGSRPWSGVLVLLIMVLSPDGLVGIIVRIRRGSCRGRPAVAVARPAGVDRTSRRTRGTNDLNTPHGGENHMSNQSAWRRSGSRAAAIAATLALIVAACGDDDDSTADEASSEVTARQHRHRPNRQPPNRQPRNRQRPNRQQPNRRPNRPPQNQPPRPGKRAGRSSSASSPSVKERSADSTRTSSRERRSQWSRTVAPRRNSTTTALDGFTGANVGGLDIELVGIGCGDDTADRIIQEVRTLVEQDGAEVVIGPLSGDESIAVANYAKDHPEVTFIDGIAGAQDTTLKVQAPNYFRFHGDGAQWNAGLGDRLHNEAGWDTVAVIADDYSFGWTSAAGFIADFCAVGGDVVSRVFPPLGTTDYSSFVQQLPDPDEVDGYFWVVGGTGTNAALEAFVNAKGDLDGRQHAGNLFFSPALASALGPNIAGAYVGGFAAPAR